MSIKIISPKCIRLHKKFVKFGRFVWKPGLRAITWMKKIGFVVHGRIRGKRALMASLFERFRLDYDVRFYETTRPREAEFLADQALQEGCDFLIAVGGDGTLHEMVNGYIKFDPVMREKSAMGLLPYGTGNDFARGYGIRRDPDQLEELIRRSAPVKLDAGLLRLTGTEGQDSIRYFDNISDIGLGADVVARVNGVKIRKVILGGTLTYFLSVLITFITFRHKRIKISWEGFNWEGPSLSLVVANGKYFGSGMGIAPEASMTDGQFEVVILGKVKIIDYLKKFGKLQRCEKIDHPEVFYHRINKLTVEHLDKKIFVEADGELEGNSPVEYECLPGVLNFLIP